MERALRLPEESWRKRLPGTRGDRISGSCLSAASYRNAKSLRRPLQNKIDQMRTVGGSPASLMMVRTRAREDGSADGVDRGAPNAGRGNRERTAELARQLRPSLTGAR